MGHERLGASAAGDGLHHRGFHLNEISLGQKLAHKGNDLAAHLEHLAGFLSDNQIHIALAIADFLVGQTVKFLR